MDAKISWKEPFEDEKKFTLGHTKLRMVFKGVYISSKICLYEKSSDQEFLRLSPRQIGNSGLVYLKPSSSVCSDQKNKTQMKVGGRREWGGINWLLG